MRTAPRHVAGHARENGATPCAPAARHVLVAPLLVAMLPSAVLAASAQKPQPAPYVRRPASGAVVGYVIDAQTRKPIEGALVSTQLDGGFADTGPATARTDAAGRYQLRAPLGRKKSSTKMSPLVIFGEPIRKREANTIEVTQLNISATCAGDKPFLGPVAIRHATVSRFRVYLDEILLAREDSDLASCAPSNFRWEYLQSFAVAPDIAARGSKVTMTARLRIRHEPGINYRLYVIAADRFLEADGILISPQDSIQRIAIPLNPSKPSADRPQHREFTATARIGRRTSLSHALLHIAMFRGTRNVTPADARPVLVQAPTSDEERAAAELCREAHYLRGRGELSPALEPLEAAVNAAPEYRFAQEMLADLYVAMNRPQDAARVLREVVELQPDDVDVTYPKLAEALLAAGQAQEAVALLLALDKDSTKRKHGTESKMSPSFNIALARGYLALSDFPAADTRFKRAGLLSPALRRQLATERARAMLAANPDSLDAHAGMARALAAAGRWEEAVAEFRVAADDEDADAWQYTDLAWALMHGFESYDDALPWAQGAVADDPNNAEARLRLGDCYRHLGQYERAAAEYAAAAELRPADFFIRHWHGLTLLWRGDTDAAAQELLAALDLAREKGEHRASFLGFFVPVATTRVLVHGFRYPEADYDYIVLDALTTLRQAPDDFLGRFNIAAALVELGLPDAALPLLRECMEASPDYVEALYAMARAHMDKSDSEMAEEELQRVVAINPLHPYANLDLAKLRLEAGDGAAAQRYVLQHRRNYPESAPRPVGPTATAAPPEEDTATSADGRGEVVERGLPASSGRGGSRPRARTAEGRP